jgi:hypothetical protein
LGASPHEGKRLLAVEGEFSGPNVASLRGSLAWAKFDELRKVKSIPVNARHNARINYPKLRKALAKQLS